MLNVKSCKVFRDRSSHQRCSIRKGVLRNYAKFTRKQLYQGLFFNKFTGLRPPILLKKRPGMGPRRHTTLFQRRYNVVSTLKQRRVSNGVFSCECCEISESTFCIEHLQTAASAVVVVNDLMENYTLSNWDNFNSRNNNWSFFLLLMRIILYWNCNDIPYLN